MKHVGSCAEVSAFIVFKDLTGAAGGRIFVSGKPAGRREYFRMQSEVPRVAELLPVNYDV